MEFVLKKLLANWIVSTVRKIHPLQTLLRLSGYAPETALISSYMEKSNTNLIVLSNHSHFWNNTQETAAISTPCWEGGGRCGGKWLLRSVGNKIFPLLVRLRDIKDNWLHAHEDMQLISRRAAGHVSCQTGLPSCQTQDCWICHRNWVHRTSPMVARLIS